MTPLRPYPESARLRVARIDHRRAADGSGAVEVHLELGDRTWTGSASGLLTREGDLRMGAEATLAAVTESTAGEFAPSLGGIKAIRAFDSWLVIVSIESEVEEGRLRLLGAEAAEGSDLVRASVLSVLDALNRVLERYLR